MKAFPHTKLERGADGRTWDTSEVRYEGMDLRDYFAAKAMQGMLSLTPEQLYTAFGGEPTTLKESVAKNAYNFADAMMKMRESK
jgi:5-formaminoimidazole-4-carboxamide-1-beta-D-ribofuranosyl 5'-monophosphate synthetase